MYLGFTVPLQEVIKFISACVIWRDNIHFLAENGEQR
jgi:hypothetical protein